MKRAIHIFGGGTFSYVRNHLALSAPAFGQTARQLFSLASKIPEWEAVLHLTKMADPMGSSIITNEDLMWEVVRVIRSPDAKAIIFNAAVCDFSGTIIKDDEVTNSGKLEVRLHSSGEESPIMVLTAKEKLISAIKPVRPDIKLASFKTTCGATETQMLEAGLLHLSQNNSDVVLINDTKSYDNIVYMNGSTRGFYRFFKDRKRALNKIVEIVTSNGQQKISDPAYALGDV